MKCLDSRLGKKSELGQTDSLNLNRDGKGMNKKRSQPMVAKILILVAANSISIIELTKRASYPKARQ